MIRTPRKSLILPPRAPRSLRHRQLGLVGGLIGVGAEMPRIIVDSADFDGTNDYMTRGAGWNGAADSKTGIASVWVRIDAIGAGSTQYIITGPTAGTDFFLSATTGIANQFLIQLRAPSAADGTRFQFNTNTARAIGGWHHYLLSWDANSGVAQLYNDDTSDLALTNTPSNNNLDYTHTDWGVGGTIAGANKVDGCVAELYFAPGQYLDFSIVANRRKFRSSSGKPVFLGATGALPTGTAPILYSHLDDGETVANFATNRGTGGNLTVTGALSTGSDSPSD